MTMQTNLGEHGLRVLARVDGEMSASAMDSIIPYEGDEPYFPDYVDANFPRNQEVTEEVVAATKGYAVADESGEIIARFEGERDGKSAYQRANDAVQGARVTLAVDVDLDEDDESTNETSPKATPAKEATK